MLDQFRRIDSAIIVVLIIGLKSCDCPRNFLKDIGLIAFATANSWPGSFVRENHDELLLLVLRRGRAVNLLKNHQLDASDDPSAMEHCLELRYRTTGTDRVYATLMVRKVSLADCYRAYGLHHCCALAFNLI